MTFYNNQGNLYKVYFTWEDEALNKYNSWKEAKKESRGKKIYLSARLYSTLYGSNEMINCIPFKTKPKISEIKRFMTFILDEHKFKGDRIHYSEWIKMRKKQINFGD